MQGNDLGDSKVMSLRAIVKDMSKASATCARASRAETIRVSPSLTKGTLGGEACILGVTRGET